jgi:hypothetical protein
MLGSFVPAFINIFPSSLAATKERKLSWLSSSTIAFTLKRFFGEGKQEGAKDISN